MTENMTCLNNYVTEHLKVANNIHYIADGVIVMPAGFC